MRKTTEALPKCPHGVYLPPGTPGSKRGNPHCSVCCAPTVRDAPGALDLPPDNRTSRERRALWGGGLFDALPAAPTG